LILRFFGKKILRGGVRVFRGVLRFPPVVFDGENVVSCVVERGVEMVSFVVVKNGPLV
jgi:hypothetical protein